MSKRKISFLIVGVLVCIFGIASTIKAGTPDEKLNDFTTWMLSLDEKVRVKVERVFDQDMGLLEEGKKGSKPDYNAWIKKIHNDLQSVLTPDQFKAFTELWNWKIPNEQLSAGSTECPKCRWAYNYLYVASHNVDLAIDTYKLFNPSDYCDFGPIPNNVWGCMLSAQYRLEKAEQKALAAFNGCYCTRAKEALYEAQNAKRFLDCAIFNTRRYCVPGAPWLSPYLESADSDLNTAINNLNLCIDEICK